MWTTAIRWLMGFKLPKASTANVRQQIVYCSCLDTERLLDEEHSAGVMGFLRFQLERNGIPEDRLNPR
jgi:hypothetical protein